MCGKKALVCIMVTHLEVCSDKAVSLEVLKVTPHEQVEEKCGLQRKEGGRREGEGEGEIEGKREQKEGRRRREGIISCSVRISDHMYLCSCGDYSGVAALENLKLNKTRWFHSDTVLYHITTKVKVHLIAEDATAVCTASEECRLKLKTNKEQRWSNLISHFNCEELKQMDFSSV